MAFLNQDVAEPHLRALHATPRQPATRIHASLTYGDLGIDAYAFGPGAARLAA